MHSSLPPLSALKAFEAAARHLSFTRAAAELSVTPGALSHQVRALEDFLGVRLFERRTRSIALTAQGALLYPGLHSGFGLIRQAVDSLRPAGDAHALVVSTSPGITSKWLAARLHRFAEKHPDIALRISSTLAHANFADDGVDVALRNLPLTHPHDPLLVQEKLVDMRLTVVASPRLIARFGPLDAPGVLARLPLIHDDSLASRPEVPSWRQWLEAAGLDGGDLARGLRFSSADHALDAALQGAGLLLTHAILAHDDVLGGRLVMPFGVSVPAGRAYYFVCPKAREKQRAVRAFRGWLLEEVNGLALAPDSPGQLVQTPAG
jgi:LysR family glycine cleavage system transcriptional activator